MMASLANVSAVIIDVGQNRGGGPEMVRLLGKGPLHGRLRE